MFRKIIFGILFLLLFACERITDSITGYSAPKNFNLGDTVAVAYNQKILNEDENISLRFKALVSDGRCPIDLRCFLAGNAEVEFVLAVNGVEAEFSLTTYGFTRDTTITDYQIELIDLTPYPHSERTYHPQQYLAYVVISKD